MTAKKPPNKWLITISISFGTLMGAIDSSIVNVALPHIRGAVGATVQEITWISTGYALANVLVMPLTAFLARLFGQKRVYMFCLVLFLVGSALCGLADSLTTLIIYRAIQGFGAGALQPTEQAILRQVFPPAEQATAMAIFGMAVMIGPAVGPTLGGLIVDNYSWPWIFYINLPVGIIGLFMVWRFVQEDEEIKEANRALAERQRRNVDWWGIVLLSVGLCCLQYFLEEGQRNDWFADRIIAVCFFMSVFCLAAFVIRELTAEVPVVNLTLFSNPSFLSGTLISAMMFAMLMANMFLLPEFMQELLGFTATQSGLIMMPRVAVMMVTSPIVGKLYTFVSARILVTIGVILFTTSSLLLSQLNLQAGQADIVLAVCVQGAGFGFLFVPLTTAALSTVPKAKIADAAGLNSLLRQIGGSMGLALFATLLERFTTVARHGLVAHLNPSASLSHRLSQLAQGMRARGIEAFDASQRALGLLDMQVNQQALMLSYDRLFLLAGIAFLGILPLLMFLRQDKTGSPKPIQMEH